MVRQGNKALVIGGGIGGMCAAIALQQAGWHVSLYERASEFTKLGAGIGLAANAMKVLGKLGVADKVREQGAPLGKAEIRTWDGKLIVDLPIAKQVKLYGTSTYIIHRSALQSILFEHLASNTSIQLNKKLLDWNQNEDSVTAAFEDGTEAVGDILSGADGIRSTVRKQLLGPTALRYSGFTALRGVSIYTDERYSKDVGGGFEAWGSGKRFGYSHLGGESIYWFAAINSQLGLKLPSGERKQAALSHFKGWYHPIEAVIAATDESAILSHDIFDCRPVANWGERRVTLLGDAAHPMLPNLGQGGAQAIEDAWVLAQCLQGDIADAPSALRIYEKLRIPRTTKVVRQSRRMGRLVQMENPAAIALRNGMLRIIPSGIQVNRLHWLVGHEV
jgi:2-polyprenyl-6-methoxyphenol hydroxylase-like FAD-dependent oxidoreductase